jgi:hypothetical protein
MFSYGMNVGEDALACFALSVQYATKLVIGLLISGRRSLLETSKKKHERY